MKFNKFTCGIDVIQEGTLVDLYVDVPYLPLLNYDTEFRGRAHSPTKKFHYSLIVPGIAHKARRRKTKESWRGWSWAFVLMLSRDRPMKTRRWL